MQTTAYKCCAEFQDFLCKVVLLVFRKKAKLPGSGGYKKNLPLEIFADSIEEEEKTLDEFKSRYLCRKQQRKKGAQNSRERLTQFTHNQYLIPHLVKRL